VIPIATINIDLSIFVFATFISMFEIVSIICYPSHFTFGSLIYIFSSSIAVTLPNKIKEKLYKLE